MWKATGREKTCMSGSLPKANYIENKEPAKFIEATGPVIMKNLGISQGHLSESRNDLLLPQQKSFRFSIKGNLHRIAYLTYKV